MNACWCHNRKRCPVCAAKTRKLRYAVTCPVDAVEQKATLRKLRKRVGYNSGAYIVVHNDDMLPDSDIVRAVLNEEMWVLYVGKSDASLSARVLSFSGAFTGQCRTLHHAGRLARELVGNELEPDLVRIITIPYPDACSLEDELLWGLSEKSRAFPRLNQKGPTRRAGSSKVVRLPDVRSLLNGPIDVAGKRVDK